MVLTAADQERAGLLCTPLCGPGGAGLPLRAAAQATTHSHSSGQTYPCLTVAR